MKDTLRLEDFTEINSTHDGKNSHYYARKEIVFPTILKTSDAGISYKYTRKDYVCAVFDSEKKLIVSHTFEDESAAHFGNSFYSAYRDTSDEMFTIRFKLICDKDILLLTYGSLIALYSIKKHTYIIPFGDYGLATFFYDNNHENDENVLFAFQSNTSIIFLNRHGQIINTATFIKKNEKESFFETFFCYRNRDSFYNFKLHAIIHEEYLHKKSCIARSDHKNHAFVVSKGEIKKNNEIKRKFGVFSYEKMKLIIPFKFDDIQLYDNGIVVINKYDNHIDMGVYSYEGEIIIPIKENQMIYHFLNDGNSELVAIKYNGLIDVVYTYDFSCILLQKCRHVYLDSFISKGDFFIIFVTDESLCGVFSVSMRKVIVPPEYTDINFDYKNKTIEAIKCIFPPKITKSYYETISGTNYVHDGWAIVPEDYSYTKLHKGTIKYDTYADVYSSEGSLLKKDVKITYSQNV